MTYDFKLTTMINATPQAIYDAWLDSRAHAAMTGGKAVQSRDVGGTVQAWDGYISGRNLELVPGERIVQSWRTTQFADSDPDSTITVMLTPVADGTLLTLEHSGVPDGQTSYEEAGWRTHYFIPMQKYFGKAKKAGAAKKAKPAARKKAAAKTKRAAKKKASVKSKAAVKKRAKKKAKAAKRRPAKKSKTRQASKRK